MKRLEAKGYKRLLQCFEEIIHWANNISALLNENKVKGINT